MNAAAALVRSGHQVDILPLFGERKGSDVRHPVQDELEADSRLVDPAPHDRLSRLRSAPSVLLDLARRHGWRGLRTLDPRLFGREAISLRPLFLAHALATDTAAPHDILHCQFAALAPYALALRRLGVVKGAVVVHFRGYDITQHVQTHGRAVYRDVFRQADRFIANCEYFREKAIALGCPADRIDVVPTGCDLAAFPFVERMPPGEGTVRLLSVGRLVEKKGHLDTLEAVRLLRAQGIDVHLTIVGEGRQREVIEARLQATGLGPHVHLAGHLAHDGVCRELAGAHLLVAASRTAPNGDEDAPVNSIKEAMASGLPVVASRHGGIPEIVEDGVTGRLCREGDPQDLANRIADMIAERHRWPEMGRAGRHLVETGYTLEASNRKALATYARALESLGDTA